MNNITVSYFMRNYKVQSNERHRRYEQAEQSRSERADQSRSEQSYQSMSGAIRVEHIRDVTSRSEQIDLRVIIRLEKSGVKASGEKNAEYQSIARTSRREIRAVPKDKRKV